MATHGIFSADGDSDVVLVKGPVLFKAIGGGGSNWGGGTVTISEKAPDGTYEALNTDTALTSDATGEVLFDYPENSWRTLKATLAGATTPTLRWRFEGQVTGGY